MFLIPKIAGKVGSPKSSFSGSSPKLQMKATRLSSSKSSILSPDKSPESSCNEKVSDSDHYSSHLAAASDPSPPPRDHRISPCFDNSPSKSQRVSRRYRFDSNIDVPSAIHLTSYTTPRFLSKDSELLPPRPPLPVDFPYFSPWYPAALAQWCQQRHHQEAFISNLKPKPGVEGLQDQVFMRHC